jgi:nucleotide-binding universal stress UspA family protein
MRVLIATGGAKHSDIAVYLGGLILRQTDATATLLTVIKQESNRAKGAAVLDRAKGLLPEGVANVHTQIRIGQQAEEIIQEAEVGKYDLVVVGSRPIHKLIKRFVGPVAEQVSSHPPCPVLVAKKRVKFLRRILICESGREPSLLQRLIERLPAFIADGTEIKVLHVMSQMTAAPGVPGWQLRANADELMAQHTPEGVMLENDLALLADTDTESEVEVRYGFVVDEIAAAANEGAYDLVIIGAHQEESWWLDNLTKQIITKVDIPALVI